MRKLRNVSLKHKITRVMVLISTAALLVASICFGINDIVTLRGAKVRDLKSLAQIIGANCQGSLSFLDEAGATQTLSAMRAQPNVIGAAVYRDGRVFAAFKRETPKTSIPWKPGADGHFFQRGTLVLFSPVTLDGERIGTVYLQDDLGDITQRMQRYAGISLLILVVSILVALVLSSLLQRVVSEPILELARTASRVSTEKNYAIRARKRTEDEIGMLIDRFNEMLGQIERSDGALQELNTQLARSEQSALAANQAKSAFLARMSHELRTPLNAIIGYSEMLQEEAEDLGHQEFLPDLQRINSAGKHLLALINDILDLSKIEAGKMDLFLETFDVADVMEDIRTTVQPLVEKNSNKLEVEGSELGVMRGDLTKVRQMLFNLLSNAAKFTSEGRILLAAERTQRDGRDWMTFTVADSGIGMTPEQAGRVFDAFVQADASTTRK
jgi:signal transduction histidine kinase